MIAMLLHNSPEWIAIYMSAYANPSSREYGYTKMTLLALFLGICFIPLTAAIG